MKPVMLITAGPSREYFDDVRFLSNGASGALGIALATRALAHDWDVHLALGPTQLSVPEGIHVHRFISAQDLEAICIELWPTVDTFVATAAMHAEGVALHAGRGAEPAEVPSLAAEVVS